MPPVGETPPNPHAIVFSKMFDDPSIRRAAMYGAIVDAETADVAAFPEAFM